MEIYSGEFITAIMVIAAAIIWYLTRSRENKGAPVNWPVVGMVPSLLWNLSNAYEWAAGIVIRNGGTFAFKGPLGSNHFFEVVTASPPNLEYILKDDFANFPRGPSFKSVFFDIFGDGLFVADDELWNRQRKAVAIAMSSTSFREQNTDRIQELVLERLIPVLEESRKKNSSLDMQDILLRLNFDSICLAISGKDAGFLLPDLPEVPFAVAFDQAIESCTYRLIIPPFVSKLMKFLNVGFERKHRRAKGIILEYASELVRFKMAAELKEKRQQCGDILSTFIHLETEEGRSPSLKSVQDLCLSVILAGRDTSSLALSWFFWLLNQHPDVEAKILSELSEILKAKFCNKPYDINTLRFSHLDLKAMQYLQAALSESMRLYPPVPVSYRQAVRDVFLPDGTSVKKGSKLLYFIYATNRMESVWGKDCREFKPERWINRDGICIKESDYKYPVFNAGPRLCLGREMAYASMKCTAAHVLLRYCLKIAPGHPVKPKFGLTMFMRHGLKLGAIEFLQKRLSDDKLKNVWQHAVRKAFSTAIELPDDSQNVAGEETLWKGEEGVLVKEGNPKQKGDVFGCEKFSAPSTPQQELSDRFYSTHENLDESSVSEITHNFKNETRQIEAVEMIPTEDSTSSSLDEVKKELDISSTQVLIPNENGDTCTASNLNYPCDNMELDSSFDDFCMGMDGDLLPELDIDPDNFGKFSLDSNEGLDTSPYFLDDCEVQEKDLAEEEALLLADVSKAEKQQLMAELPNANNFAISSDTSVKEELSSDDKKTNGQQASKSTSKTSQGKRKIKVDWTPDLHRRFVHAVEQLGVDKAVPSRILELMGVNCLTRHNIASHLQV